MARLAGPDIWPSSYVHWLKLLLLKFLDPHAIHHHHHWYSLVINTHLNRPTRHSKQASIFVDLFRSAQCRNINLKLRARAERSSKLQVKCCHLKLFGSTCYLSFGSFGTLWVDWVEIVGDAWRILLLNLLRCLMNKHILPRNSFRQKLKPEQEKSPHQNWDCPFCEQNPLISKFWLDDLLCHPCAIGSGSWNHWVTVVSCKILSPRRVRLWRVWRVPLLLVSDLPTDKASGKPSQSGRRKCQKDQKA